jgi:DNA polymerase-3 subunit gamma/tau
VADAALDADAARCVRALRSLYTHGYDARRFCRDLLEHFRHLAVLGATGDRGLLAGLPEAEVDALVAQAAKRSSDDLQRAFRVLLDADEAIAVPARTIDPQLVLEMAVLRLATLAPLVPIDVLAQRLESLAAGGAPVSGGATRPATPSRAAGAPPQPASPATPAAPRPASAVGTAAPVAGDGRGVFDAMLQRVQAERVSLFMALAAARPLGLDGGALRIGVENEALRRDLTRKESLDVLRTIASEVAGRPLVVEIGPLPAGHVHETPAAQAKRRTEETLADPLVKAAVEIFGGAEVRGVRDRRA